MFCQLQKGPYCLFRRCVGGDAVFREQGARGSHRVLAEPHGQNRFFAGLDDRYTGTCDGFAGYDGRGRVNQQYGITGDFANRNRQRARITLNRGVANDVHWIRARPGGRQKPVEIRPRIQRERGQRAAARHHGVGGQHRGATAIGHDQQAFSRHALCACQGFRSVEQVVGGCDPQDAGAPQGRVHDFVAAGKRAGMRCCSARPLGSAAGFDRDDDFCACRGTCSRHEFAGGLDRLHVKQNRVRARVASQIVQQVAEIDIGAFAQRNETRKPDAMGLSPVQHRRGKRPRL